MLKDNNVLIEVKATLRLGDTLDPVIFMSNEIHVSKIVGHKKEWPVYMTIGNLSLKICQMPSAHSIIMVALLPIPIKKPNIPPKRLDEQWQTK
jgi:hypothetical protein